MQRCTVRKPISFSGYPILLGGKSAMTIRPARAGFGIRVKSNGKTSKPLSAETIRSAGWGLPHLFGWSTTGVKVGRKVIPTLEHHVGALVGAGITDALIDLGRNRKAPALSDTAKTVFEAIRKERKPLNAEARPFRLNQAAFSRMGLSQSEAARELNKRGIPKGLFSQGKTQGVIMLAPRNTRLPDRIFLKQTNGPSTIAALIDYPGFRAVKRQWVRIPLTQEGFEQVMSARGLSFYPAKLKGLFKALKGRSMGGVRIHDIDPKTRLMVDREKAEYDNPPEYGETPGEIARHKITDFLINLADGIQGVEILLYRTGHKTEIEMMQKAIRERILQQ